MDLKFLQDRLNSRAVDDFLGLSPNHLFLILYHPVEAYEHILTFNPRVNFELVEIAPVVRDSRLLIQLLGEAGEVRATQNGFLPKKLVNAVHALSIPEERQYRPEVQSEEYAPQVLALRTALTGCGWMKLRNRKFSLTKTGAGILESGFTAEHYTRLLKFWLRDYNWGFADRYPVCSIVQQGAVFSLYILKQHAKDFLPADQFTEIFSRAFRMALEEAMVDCLYETLPAKQLMGIIDCRFFDRFAGYFGLLDRVQDRDWSKDVECRVQVRTTPLFDDLLHWFRPDKQRIVLDESASSARH